MTRALTALKLAWKSGLIAGSLCLPFAHAATPDSIESFAAEDESHQTVTEIVLTNGDVVTVVYSQGRFEYPPQQGDVTTEFSEDGATLRTLSTPQMSEHFIPGLFGYTAAGGPAVEQNQQVTKSSLRTGDYDENDQPQLDRATARSTSGGGTTAINVQLPGTQSYSADYSLKASSR